MKDWKLDIVKKLGEKSEELREINFRDVANECGFKHIKTQEVEEIADEFLKTHPTYRAVRFVKNQKVVSSTESLFTTLVLTECEYETEDEFLREVNPSIF